MPRFLWFKQSIYFKTYNYHNIDIYQSCCIIIIIKSKYFLQYTAIKTINSCLYPWNVCYHIQRMCIKRYFLQFILALVQDGRLEAKTTKTIKRIKSPSWTKMRHGIHNVMYIHINSKCRISTVFITDSHVHLMQSYSHVLQ